MKNSTVVKKINYILGFIVILVSWQLISMVVNNELIIPSIFQTLQKTKILLGSYKTYELLFFTFLKIIVILGISLIISGFLVSMSIISIGFEAFLKPIIILIRSLPIATISTILLIIFFKANIRYIGTMIVVLFITIPLMYEIILCGVKSINSNIVDDIKTLSTLNFMVLNKVYFPLIMPNVISSIVQSYGLAFKVLIMSEIFLLPKNSIGKEIVDYASALQMDAIFAWTLLLLLIIWATDFVVSKVKI